MNCWKCNADLDALTLPLLRLETCRTCGSDLHVCRFCVFYDTSVARSCKEPVADDVKDKERANFCGYLMPNPHAYIARDPAAAASRDALASLFGEPEPARESDAKTAALKDLDDLFSG